MEVISSFKIFVMLNCFYIKKRPKKDLKVKAKVTQLCPILCNPMDYTVHGILQARIQEWVDIYSLPGNLPNPGIEPRSPALQVDSLPAEPPGKPKNTGVGSLSLSSGSSLPRN